MFTQSKFFVVFCLLIDSSGTERGALKSMGDISRPDEDTEERKKRPRFVNDSTAPSSMDDVLIKSIVTLSSQRTEERTLKMELMREDLEMKRLQREQAEKHFK